MVYSLFDGEKKRTWDNPAPEYAYKVKSGEASQPLVSGNTTSDTTVVEEARQAICAELTKNLKIWELTQKCIISQLCQIL